MTLLLFKIKCSRLNVCAALILSAFLNQAIAQQLGNPIPSNDLCANAETINCGETKTGNISAATDNDAPGTCNLGSSQGVWYHYTGTGDYINLSTCNGGTDYNAQIEIYKGDCNSLECVAAEDTDVSCSSYFHASVGFCSEQDVDYYVYVSVSFGGTGNFELTANCQPEPPQVEIEARGGSLVLCGGSSVELHASQGAASYSWSPGSQTGSSVYVTEAGTFIVTGEYNGCTSSDTITVDSLVADFFLLDDTLCESDPEVILLSTGTMSGTFSGSGLSSSGSIAAIATGLPAAIPDDDPSGVSVNVTPSGVPGTAMGTDVSLGSVCVEVVHAWNGDLVVTLTSPNGTEITLQDRPRYPETPSGCSLSNFSYTFIPGTGNDNENHCDNNASGIFTAFGGDDINDLNDGSDPNGTWVLKVTDMADQNTGTIENFSLNFNNPVGFLPQIAGPGTYQITLHINSCENECTASVTKTITVLEGPTANMWGGGSACEGDSVQVNLDLTGTPPWNVTYTDGTDTFAVGSISNANNFFKVTNNGNYEPISVTDATGCPGSVSGLAITLFNIPPSINMETTPTGQDSILCFDDQITLTANTSGGATPYVYDWDNIPGTSNSSSILVADSGVYCATVTDALGCGDSACLEIFEIEEPQVCMANVNTQNAPTIDFSGSALGGYITYTWDFGDGNSGAGQYPTHTYTSTGPKTITMTATNVCGSCTQTITIVIVSVGIDKNIGIENLEIYPNPTNENVIISFKAVSNENISLQLNNEMGQEVYDERLVGSAGEYIEVLEIDHLAKGIYTLQIIGSKGFTTRKIVKQ